MNFLSLIRQPITALSPIAWGQSEFDDSFLILKWGENPYSPPTAVQQAVCDATEKLNRYPNLMMALKQQLAKYTQSRTNQITLVNGLDKAFRLLAEVFIDPGDEVITFAPSYPVINSAVQIMGGQMQVLPLSSDFTLPSFEVIKAKVCSTTKAIYICNPNNPTGTLMASLEEIEAVLKLGVIVIVDEAYYEFAQFSALGLLQKYDNLIIMRSFSKTFALAGLRVGYLISSREIAAKLAAVEETLEIFNISTLSLAGAIAALNTFSEYQSTWQQMTETRTKLSNFLESYWLSPTPSLCSFLLFSTKKLDLTSKQFIKLMKDQKIILKDCLLYQGLDPYSVYTAIPKLEDLPKLQSAISAACLQLLPHNSDIKCRKGLE